MPDRTVVVEGTVVIEHFYRGGDHGPPHLHVSGGGGTTRIGQNGAPIEHDPELTAEEANVVKSHLKVIRKTVRKIGRWHWFNDLK
ncbi:MAG TPA: hypothetical protein VND64_12180 [Pirellulales bacterium]|nr:hypothetical protein [Pirellulales bacterium]